MAAKRPQRDDNLLEDIQRRPETLNKSERKVAEAILRDPTAANRRSIAVLARAAYDMKIVQDALEDQFKNIRPWSSGSGIVYWA